MNKERSTKKKKKGGESLIRKRGDFLVIREDNSWEELSIDDPSPRNTVSWKLSALLGTIRYKITRSIRHCSWSNLCAVGGPAITDTKRTIIVRRLIQSVVSVISRVWFIWDRGRGRIAIASNENNTKLASYAAALSITKFLRARIWKKETERKFSPRRGTTIGWKRWWK